MRLTFAFLVLGAILLSITSASASTQADNKKDAVVPSGEGNTFLRGLEATDSEERWGIRDLFGRKKFEKMLINDRDKLSKFNTKTITSKLKGTGYKAELLDYLNWRVRAVRKGTL